MTPPVEAGPAIVGWLLVGFGALDLGLAVFIGLVRPPADARARKVFPLALAIGGVLLAGVGAAFLLGCLGGPWGSLLTDRSGSLEWSVPRV